MLYAGSPRDRMLCECWRVNHADEKPRINSALRTEYEQFGGANSGIACQHRFVEIRPEFAIEHVARLKCIFSTLDVGGLTLPYPFKSPGGDMLKTNVNSVWATLRIDLHCNKV